MNRFLFVCCLSLALLSAIGLQSCDPSIIYRLIFALYDAPTDDPLYAGTYLTIAGLEVNGKKVDDFPDKVTLEVSALQAGITARLGEAKVKGTKLDEITLILDYDKDDKGQAPGCYLMTVYDRKIDLANGRRGEEVITIKRPLNLEGSDETVNLIIDFDLRKTIRPSQPGDQSEASLINGAAIGQALRVVQEEETGHIKGQLTLPPDLFSQANACVVYAYRAGTFDRATETQDLDGNGITFEGAVSSTLVEVTGSQSPAPFSLYYLEPGDYELVFEAYERYEFSHLEAGFFRVAGATNLTLPVTVTRQQEVTLDLTGDTLLR